MPRRKEGGDPLRQRQPRQPRRLAPALGTMRAPVPLRTWSEWSGVVIEQWRVQYNTHRPHSSLGYRPPAPAAYHAVIFTNAIQQSLVVM